MRPARRLLGQMSKYCRVDYKGHVLNIVDTPGHGDFSGEVERVLSMVDGETSTRTA